MRRVAVQTRALAAVEEFAAIGEFAAVGEDG
jgi:hypothetical protein